MNEREIEERLKTAIEKTAPNDFSGVLSRISDEKGSPIMTKKKNHRKFISGAIAACLALAILGGGGTYYSKAYAVSSIVSLDVNPSIELRVNSREKILACNPLNDEAIAILADMDGGKDLKGVDLGVAVNALIGALVRNGYLDSVSSSILISVEDKNEERAAKLRREVTETVDSVLAANSSGASVLSQTLNKDTNLDSIAKNNNISTGKAALVSQVCALNGSLDLTQLAALSVDELNDLLEVGAPGMPIGKNAAADIALADSGLNSAGAHIEVDSDIDDIPAHYDVEVEYAGVEYEYKIDAYTGAIIEKKTDTHTGHETVAVPATPEKTTDIGLEAAKATALKHAGVSVQNAVFTKSEIDHDDGVVEYEFEFIVGNIEYECKVNASGKVIKFETETIDHDDEHNETHHDTIVTSDIGEEAAKSAAFRHAGVDAANVYELEVERDIDDGRLEYEIEFKCGNMEYEYKIDAYTGAIIEKKTEDRNGSVHEPIVVPPTPEKATEIGLESAKAIALKHAGVSAEKAVFTKSEIDHDDGVIEYEFEFIVGNIEYECKVNASGTVIKFETETIDRGDDHHKETVTTTDIGVEAAKSTVFRHAGVDAAKVYELEVERDIDDGRLEYEIEFKCGNMEYEYKIDGATGAILEHEADYDD